MKRLLLIAICLILLPCACFAEDIYIAQTLHGADSGINCSSAHSSGWFNTSGNWANPKQIGKIGPGDIVHLCGTIKSQLATHASGLNGSPITILFENGAKYSNTAWTAGTAAITINNNYITLDGGTNGIVEATDNGTTSSFGGGKAYNRNIDGVLINAADNVIVKKLTIRTIYNRLANSTDCINAGYNIHITGLTTNITISENTISDGYYGIYGALGNSDTITLSNNTISNTSIGINIAPGSTSLTGSNIFIYGNAIRGGTKWDGIFNANCQANGCSSSCLTDKWHHQDGMHLFSQTDTGWMDNVNVFNNYLQDFGIHSTAHIYIEYHGMKNVKIYNNVLVNTGSNYASNGMITVKAADNVKIYNNTLVGAGPSNNQGIYWNSNSGVTPQGAELKNNVISGVRTIMAWAVGTTWTSDNNNFFNYNPSYIFQDSSNAWYSLLWWNGQGYDAQGTTEDPKLGISYALTSSSPASVKSGGADLSSVFTSDKNGVVTRPSGSGWSMGAYQAPNMWPNPAKGQIRPLEEE